MKYKTFRRLLNTGLLVVSGGIGYGLYSVATAKPPVTPHPPPIAMPASAPPPPAPAPKPLTTPEIRELMEAFLKTHGDHNGRKSWADCVPDVPFHVTAVRFPDSDHQRWFKNDPKKWSQLKLTNFADGRHDEKWLLKNGHTYKREVLDSAGKVIETERFDGAH